MVPRSTVATTSLSQLQTAAARHFHGGSHHRRTPITRSHALSYTLEGAIGSGRRGKNSERILTVLTVEYAVPGPDSCSAALRRATEELQAPRMPFAHRQVPAHRPSALLHTRGGSWYRYVVCLRRSLATGCRGLVGVHIYSGGIELQMKRWEI